MFVVVAPGPQRRSGVEGHEPLNATVAAAQLEPEPTSAFRFSDKLIERRQIGRFAGFCFTLSDRQVSAWSDV